MSPRPAGRPAALAVPVAPAADRLRRLGAARARRSAPAPVALSLRRPEGLLGRPPGARSRRLPEWADGARPPGLGHRLAPVVPEGAAAPQGRVPGDRAATEARGPAVVATEVAAREVGWDAVPCRRPRPDEAVRVDAAGPRSVVLAVAGATWRSWSRPS
ncbi:MAG TPA: hypothetical protein VG779_07605 [Actinomycetota bacterium]|nr:hypothetical protein [Actinomycetota bacterium]